MSTWDGSTRVALIQMCSGEEVLANLERVSQWLAVAAERGAQLAILPENFAYFGPESRKASIAEELGSEDGPIVRTLSQAAREHGIAVVGGGMPERSSEPARPYNSSVVFGSAGQRLAVYRKLHLFDVEIEGEAPYRESRATLAGDAAEVACVAGMKLGLSICYDLRFSALFQCLVQRGAQGLVVTAAFTQETGKAHWHALLRARAIEFQCWVLAAAQQGSHPRQRKTYGHSLVVDPWGRVVAELAKGEGVLTVDVDLAQVREVRTKMPQASHRRSF